MGTNVTTTFLTAPAEPKKVLAIKLPFLVMIIKNVLSIRYWCLAQKVFHFRSVGIGRQKYQKKIQSQQLSEYYSSETVHLHNAYEIGRRLEPDPVQLE